MVLSPDRHTLLIVVAGTVIGIPAFDRGLAGGDLARPRPGCTWPMKT